MKFPAAQDPKMVGQYPAIAKSGGGFFYDELLEYRVWMHPESGAEDLHNGDDYFHSFQTYEEASAFALTEKGAEHPLALVRQQEHVNEPKPGTYEHVKEERIAEWKVEWLAGTRRKKHSIAVFLLKKQVARAFIPFKRSASMI